MRAGRHRCVGAAVAGAVLLAAPGCADDDPQIAISGSSTVEPISTRVAERYEDVDPVIEITVDGPGTGDGFATFCAGETDITNASRPIKAEEASTCAEQGIEFIELKVAYDGIVVVTNPANEAVECLSFEDLYALVGPESQGVERWSDAQDLATELGSVTELPDAPLSITAPGEESGTYDSFVEIVLKDIGEARAEAGAISEDQAETTRPDYTSQGNDNAIIQGIEGSDSSLGWIGFAFAEEAGDEVKELSIAAAPDGECVAPSAESIADGTYPISRDLFVYVSAAAADRPEVAAYVDYYLGEGYGSVSEVGYVPLPPDQLAETVARWEARTVSSVDAEGAMA